MLKSQSAIPAKSRFLEVGEGSTIPSFFFCAVSVSLPSLYTLVPKTCPTAEGLSWLSQLYYFQQHDETVQQLISKLRVDVFGINN